MRNCGHVHDAEDTHRLRGLAALHFTCDCGSSRIARTPRPRCSARLQESAGAKYGVGDSSGWIRAAEEAAERLCDPRRGG